MVHGRGKPDPLDAGGPTPSELRVLHGRVVGHLTTPGRIVDGNEEPT